MSKKVNIKEIDIKSLIKKAVNEGIEEFRGNVGDGDLRYHRPNGDVTIFGGPEHGWAHRSNKSVDDYGRKTGEGGKRTKDNLSRGMGKDSHKWTHMIPNELSNGKGSIIAHTFNLYNLKHTINDDGTLVGTDKVEWTDAEKEKMLEIKSILENDLFDKVWELILLTKEEGNKKRGYNGPEEEPEESHEEEPALALSENDLRYIAQKVKKSITEDTDLAQVLAQQRKEKQDVLKQKLQNEKPEYTKVAPDTASLNDLWAPCKNPGNVQWGPINKNDGTQTTIDKKYRRSGNNYYINKSKL